MIACPLFFEGKSLPALLMEGATRARDRTSEASIEGKSLPALPVEGATRAPIIVFWAFSKGHLTGKS
jgi:hypothetical protein